jgi:hypothetical protein
MMCILGYGAFLRTKLSDPLGSIIWTDFGFGFLILSLLALVFNFFIPLGNHLAWIILVIGAVLFIRYYRKNLNLKPVLVSLFVSFILAVLAVDNHFIGDSLLYHIPILKWLKENVITLGAANIHDRFGYSSILHNVMALLSPSFEENSYIEFVLPGFYGLFLLGLLEIISKAKDLRTTFLSMSMILFSVIVWGRGAMFDSLGSPMTDVPATLLSTMILISILLWNETLKPTQLFWILSLSLLAFMTKASQAWLLVTCIWCAWRMLKQDKKYLLGALLSLSIVFLLWEMRSLFVSGCLLFPVEKSCLPLPWTIPQAQLEDVRNWILSWARTPEVHYSQVLGNNDWIPGWWQRTLTIKGFRISSVVFILGFVYSLIKRRSHPPLIVWISAAAGMALWSSAPDLRFAIWFFMIFGSYYLAFVLESLFMKFPKQLKILGLIIGLFWLQDYLRIFTNVIRKNPVAKVNDLSEIGPMKRLTSPEGVTYSVPVSSNNFCGFTEFPCSPFPHPHLEEVKWGFWTGFKSQ